MITKSIYQKIRHKGIAAVEAAVVFPLLCILVFGVIEYGWMFLKAHQITNAARSACRIAIRPSATNQNVTDRVTALMAIAGIAGETVTTYPADITLDNVGVGGIVEVEIVVPWANMAIINFSFLPAPENIQASVIMAKEGV